MTAKKLFLTGEPGVGKTTVLQKVLATLNDTCVGFYATELREDGQRVGFDLQTVNIPEPGGPLAHVNFKTGHHVGKYQVDLTCMDRIVACAGLFNENKILLIDEIGWMQSFSEPYRDFVDEALGDPNQSILAIIKAAPVPWVDEVKQKFAHIPTWNITLENRTQMPDTICRYLLD